MQATQINQKQPAVSIILPTYNRAKFLPEAFAAIKSQTCTDWDLIIVDDGSTDNTQELVTELTSDWTQSVRYIRQENQGPYGARNTGLDAAAGRYIAFYDSDDIWLPHHLANCVAALDANADVDWVYGACQIVDNATQKTIAASTFYEDGHPRQFFKLHTRHVNDLRIIEDANVTNCTILGGLMCGLQNSVTRRDIFENERFESKRRNEGEDQLAVIRALKRGVKIAYYDRVHVVYRIHSANSSNSASGASLDKRVHIDLLLIDGYERLARDIAFNKSEQLALRRRLNRLHFWHLGYSLLWQNGRDTEALAHFRKGLSFYPSSLRCWKTYFLSQFRARFVRGKKLEPSSSEAI